MPRDTQIEVRISTSRNCRAGSGQRTENVRKTGEGYSIFNLEGERLYNDLKDWKFKGEPSLYIQLEDGSWHHLDPADGSLVD